MKSPKIDLKKSCLWTPPYLGTSTPQETQIEVLHPSPSFQLGCGALINPWQMTGQLISGIINLLATLKG